jgi:hypothetical protein
MFNFMLIVFGIFATAIVTAIDKHLAPGFTAALCFIAAAVAAIFVLLDWRNRDLLRLAEELLTNLEKNVIFGERTIKDRRQISYAGRARRRPNHSSLLSCDDR